MPLNPVKEPWFNWNDKWSPRTFLQLNPTDDPHFHWIVPDHTFIHLVGFTALFIPDVGIRSTTMILRFWRAEQLLFIVGAFTKFGSINPTYLNFYVGARDQTTGFDGAAYVSFLLPDYLYLQPGDLLDFHLISPIGTDFIESGTMFTRSYNV